MDLGPEDAGPADLGADMPDLGPIPTATSWVVTADFLAHTVTVWNRDALIDGVSGADRAVLFSIDLSAYSPGPVELAVAPDGHTAVVCVGPGFLDTSVGSVVGVPSVPPGGTLLIVDLMTRAVTHEIHTMDVPMSVAITPDGTRAIVACYGTNTTHGSHLAIVSLPDGALLSEIDVGDRPEQVVISPDGLRGVVNLDGPQTVLDFDPANVATTLSAGALIGGDPDESAFIGGDDLIIIARSLGPSGFTTVDLTDAAHPAVLATLDVPGVPYGATPIPGTRDVLMPIGSVAAQLARVTVDAAGTPTVASMIALSSPRSFAVPAHAALDGDGVHAYLPYLGAGRVEVVDLTAGTSRGIPWAGRAGPTWAVWTPLPH